MLKIQITGISRVRDDLTRELEQLVQKVSVELHQAVVEKTPVRSGRARAGWQTRRMGNLRVEERNQVPYIERLENNYSKQTRGRGIIGPALNQVKGKFK